MKKDAKEVDYMAFANRPEEYNEKLKRINTALRGGTPDRVPSLIQNMTWGFGYSKTNIPEVYKDRQKQIDGNTSFLKDIYTDANFMPCLDFPLEINDILKPEQPQYRINPDGCSMQHVENSPMLPEEYVELAKDPRAFIANVLLPRRYPILNSPYPQNYELLKKVYDAQMYFIGTIVAGAEYQKQVYGMPAFGIGVSYIAPDFCFDFLRGFKGLMIDIRRKVSGMKEAFDALNKYEIRNKLGQTKKDEIIFIPLHSATFMNAKTYDELYWPYLKEYCDAIIAKKAIPTIYLEGDWTMHAESLNDMAPHNVCAMIEKGDPAYFKKTIGKNVSLVGGIPTINLRDCTPEESIEVAKKALDIYAPGGGYIFSQDKILLSAADAAAENLIAVNEYVRDNGKY